MTSDLHPHISLDSLHHHLLSAHGVNRSYHHHYDLLPYFWICFRNS